ncbi:MAG: rubrerythrin family protein [Omnitrophica WOR_2 bacterium]
MTKSFEDLQSAFAGESQANRRYLAFAKKADEEGYPQAAKLFRAAAAAETIHALNHLRAMGEVKSTEENLRTAIAGENYEAVKMYPAFMIDAEAEGERKALNSFRMAWEVEKVHEALYCKTLEMMKELDEKAPVIDYYVCPVCGYTHEGGAPDKCPVCGTAGKRFERIE